MTHDAIDDLLRNETVVYQNDAPITRDTRHKTFRNRPVMQEIAPPALRRIPLPQRPLSPEKRIFGGRLHEADHKRCVPLPAYGTEYGIGDRAERTRRKRCTRMTQQSSGLRRRILPQPGNLHECTVTDRTPGFRFKGILPDSHIAHRRNTVMPHAGVGRTSRTPDLLHAEPTVQRRHPAKSGCRPIARSDQAAHGGVFQMTICVNESRKQHARMKLHTGLPIQLMPRSNPDDRAVVSETYHRPGLQPQGCQQIMRGNPSYRSGYRNHRKRF